MPRRVLRGFPDFVGKAPQHDEVGNMLKSLPSSAGR
jgi:hypothetical protein